jgi:hypothetical protein
VLFLAHERNVHQPLHLLLKSGKRDIWSEFLFFYYYMGHLILLYSYLHVVAVFTISYQMGRGTWILYRSLDESQLEWINAIRMRVRRIRAKQEDESKCERDKYRQQQPYSINNIFYCVKLYGELTTLKPQIKKWKRISEKNY